MHTCNFFRKASFEFLPREKGLVRGYKYCLLAVPVALEPEEDTVDPPDLPVFEATPLPFLVPFIFTFELIIFYN